jgi:ATP-dependent Clp protease ATP-binding subunit ClpC
MHGFNFTERVRRVLAAAREEAVDLNHEYVGTEHLLLGLLREDDGVAMAVLQNLAVDADAVREQTLALVKRSDRARRTGPDLPYTSRAKKVIEFAMNEARDLHHEYVGTEHLLLGLLREETGVAAQVLQHEGAELAAVRQEIRLLLGPSRDELASRAVRTRKDAGRVSPTEGRKMHPIGFEIRVDCDGGYWFAERFERASDAITFLESLPPRPADS